MSENSKKCFVIQPFDGGWYDELYKDVFEPAIRKAGLVPYRADEGTPGEIIIANIEAEIKAASIIFAEVSEDNPNVWYEIGYARALNKPLVMVCHKERELPFDIKHRRTVKAYPKKMSRSSYKELQENITAALLKVQANNSQETEKPQQETKSVISSNPPAEKEDWGLSLDASKREREKKMLALIYRYDRDSWINREQFIKDAEGIGIDADRADFTILRLIEAEFFYRLSDLNLNVREKAEKWLIENEDYVLKVVRNHPQKKPPPIQREDDDDSFSPSRSEDDIPF